MIKAVLYTVLAVLLFAWVSNAKFSFKPFSVEFPKWREGVGILFVVVGVNFIRLQGEIDSRRETVDQVIELLEKQIAKPTSDTNAQ